MTELEPAGSPEEVPPPDREPPPAVVIDVPEEQPTDAGLQDLNGQLLEGLYGATASGGLDPVPVLTLGGQRLTGAVDGGLAGRVVLDGVSIRWGRQEILEQPDPATGSVELFDATRTWATTQDLVGQLVTLHWEDDVATTTSGYGSTVFFRGRVSTVKVVPWTVLDPVTQEDVDGSLVSLTMTSILTDLANISPSVDWPAETMDARRLRVAASSAQYLPHGVTTRAYWLTPQVGPVPAASQKSLYDHLLSLFESSGADRMTYWPPDEQTLHLPRRDYYAHRGLAQLWWDPAGAASARAGLGVYARPFTITPNGAVYAGFPSVLDAREVEYAETDGVQRAGGSRVSRAAVTHPDSGNGYATRTETAFVTGADEVALGVRTVAQDSIIAWNSWAAQAAGDLAAFASKEGGAWRLQPLKWRVENGFDDNLQVNLFLWGGEHNGVIFLQGSFLASLGIRPIYGVMGARIGYRDGAWELDLDLAPAVTTLNQHCITWEEIDNGTATYEVQLWDTPNPRGLHPSLSIDDLQFVASGLGVPSIPPDTGWDRTQSS